MRAACIGIGWAMVAAIVWLSLTPAPPSIDVPQGDKLGHLLGYGTIMFWFGQLYVTRRARVAYALGFAAMGVALELTQRELGYRSYEVFDMYANALGVALGWGAALTLPRALPAARTG
jgi:VanZ family protein